MTTFLAQAARDAIAIAAFVFVFLLICGAVTARSADCHKHATHIHCH